MPKTRKILLSLSDRLEAGVKKLRGAADRLAPQAALSLADCEKQNWQNIRPGFVLSCGRSGTQMLNTLLRLSPAVDAHHRPRPELIRASRRAYEEIAIAPELFREVLKSAREELLLEAARRGRVFVETNNRITFFAPVIPDVFPRAVFIHLVRHPGDFVRSGIRRQWYSGTHEHDLGRIRPVGEAARREWEQCSQIEKIGWLWNETNRFIEDFKKPLPAERLLLVKAEELFTDPAVAARIFDFLGVENPPVSELKKMIATPVNVQRKGEFPRYAEWSEEQKDELRRAAPLAEKYGYRL